MDRVAKIDTVEEQLLMRLWKISIGGKWLGISFLKEKKQLSA